MKSSLSYVIEHIIWFYIILYAYDILIFRTLPGLTLEESENILIGMVVLLGLLGLLYTMDDYRNRTDYNVIYNFAIPYGLYTAIAYFPFYNKYIIIMCLIAVILTAICVYFIFTPKLRKGYRSTLIMKQRRHKLIQAIRRNVSISMVGILIMVTFRQIIFSTVMYPNVKVTDAYGEEYRMANNMDTILLLQEDEWKTLTLEEKLDVCQVVANVEGNYFGLPNELNVKLEELDPSVNGYYSDDTHEISLRIEHVENGTATQVLESLCHECYHAYSYRLCDLYKSVSEEERNLLIFDNASLYMEEFGNYVDGNDDIFGYYFQNCEADARSYATLAVEDYYNRINEHLGINEETESAEEETADEQISEEKKDEEQTSEETNDEEQTNE